MSDETKPQDDTAMSPASTGSARTTREIFESLTHLQQTMLLEAIVTVPRWVVTGNAIQRTAAAPVVFVRAYQLHRRHGMKVRPATYWALKWAQAFCF